MTETTVAERAPADAGALLVVNDLRKHFPVKRGLLGKTLSAVQAVDDVSFEVAKGETLGIVGESGCGKSTTARLLMRLIEPDAGTVAFAGKVVGAPGGIGLRDLYRDVQMVFQDSYASLNPRLPISMSIAYGPLSQGTPKKEAMRAAAELLEQVGLDPVLYANRYPHELSGGQKQRVNIARALALKPRLIILDEAVSALDKSIEAQILNLLLDLKRAYDLTYVFISHDLNVIRFISDRVMVMYLGHVAEVGSVADIYDAPAHPYTEALLAAMPSMDPRKRTLVAPIAGDPPNPIDPPPGCRFAARCPYAADVCTTKTPTLRSGGARGKGHFVACHMRDSRSGHPQAGTAA